MVVTIAFSASCYSTANTSYYNALSTSTISLIFSMNNLHCIHAWISKATTNCAYHSMWLSRCT